jgi:RNA polymerase sigma-70 factor (ECF subfamily)
MTAPLPPDEPAATHTAAPGARMDRVASRVSHWLASAAASVGLPGSAAPPAPQPRDWALWRAACDGHAPSANRLVRELTPQAYGLAIQMVGKAEDAQDAVQDAFLRLWRSHPSDTHGAKLATYFNTIVLNCCRSQLTSRREWATEHEALTELHDAQQLRDAEAGVAGQAALGSETSAVHTTAPAQLQAALAQLPARQRMAIAMWTYADASATDIARTLDIDPNAAHQLLHRAKSALRSQLEAGGRP